MRSPRVFWSVLKCKVTTHENELKKRAFAFRERKEREYCIHFLQGSEFVFDALPATNNMYKVAQELSPDVL